MVRACGVMRSAVYGLFLPVFLLLLCHDAENHKGQDCANHEVDVVLLEQHIRPSIGSLHIDCRQNQQDDCCIGDDGSMLFDEFDKINPL